MFATFLIVLCLGGAVFQPPATRPAEAIHSAEALLARYDAAADPEFDALRREDQAYVQDWEKRRNEAWQQRYAAAVELARSYPDHPRVTELLAEGMSLRYYLIAMERAAAAGDPGDIEAWNSGRKAFREEVTSWLAEENTPASVRQALEWVELRLRLMRERPLDNDAITAVLPRIEALRQADPEGWRPRELLMWAAMYSKGEQRTALLKKLAEEEPDTNDGKWAAGTLRREQAIGQPFEFAFDDLLTGRRVTSDDLKGKVLVIDFWGTWCGICLAMTPDLKAAYEKYRGRGVEFIGVVMEDPEEAEGRQKAITYLQQQQVPWPQWYQEQGWDSDFALSFGVDGLPDVFIVDAKGNLRSYRGRPDQDLHKLLEQLLAERDAAAVKPE